MNTYELIVGKDCKYSLKKSPYVMGRIMGILEGSGAETIDRTFRINEGCPMRISFVANKKQINRIESALMKNYLSMVRIVKY